MLKVGIWWYKKKTNTPFWILHNWRKPKLSPHVEFHRHFEKSAFCFRFRLQDKVTRYREMNKLFYLDITPFKKILAINLRQTSRRLHNPYFNFLCLGWFIFETGYRHDSRYAVNVELLSVLFFWFIHIQKNTYFLN